MKNSIVALLIVVVVLISGIAGYTTGNRSTSTTTSNSSNTSLATLSTQTTISTSTSGIASKDIGNVFVSGTANINGSNLLGTLDVVYPNSALSGNLNATIANASVTLDCNDSFFTINADNRVVVNLTIVGNGNTVNLDGLRLNMTIDGNLNLVGVMPQPVMMYSEHISGTGDRIIISPLPP